jgi:hypothetical protein
MQPRRFLPIVLCIGAVGSIGCPDHRPSPPAKKVISSVSDKTTEQLVVMLSDKGAATRLDAAHQLLARDPELAAEHNLVGIAIESLSDKSHEVRCSAARLLGSVSAGEDESVAALRHALRDEHLEVRTQAVAALARLASPSGSRVAVGIETYPARSTADANSADLLSVVPDLVKLMDDKSVLVRTAAVDAVVAIQPELSDEAIKRISAVVSEVVVVWSPFCSLGETTSSETSVRVLPFRVERTERTSNRQRPPTREDFRRALEDAQMEPLPAEVDLTDLELYEQSLTSMGDSLITWEMSVEHRLAKRGIDLWER